MGALIELIWIVIKTALYLGALFFGICLLGWIAMLIWMAIMETNLPLIASILTVIGFVCYGLYRLFDRVFKKIDT